MKNLIILIVIFAATFVSCTKRSYPSSISVVHKMPEHMENSEPIFRSEKILIPEIGLLELKTCLYDSPERNNVSIEIKKSDKSIPVYNKSVTLHLILDCYKNYKSENYTCVLYQGEGIIIYCSAEDSEEFPGRYLYIQYATEKSTNKIVYDLVNLKLTKKEVSLPGGYRKPFESKVESKMLGFFSN